uniref:Endosome-associated-trafficking regulator 1 n=1 Tax=Ficedula albicollis TaxID=59894 RepID=U3JGC2_FICAL
MRKLEKKLEENKIKEEKEAQDLEAMVQHVEQNLQLMTKRAAKAENSAAKLRQENAQLQVQSSTAGAAGIHLGIEPVERILQGLRKMLGVFSGSVKARELCPVGGWEGLGDARLFSARMRSNGRN